MKIVGVPEKIRLEASSVCQLRCPLCPTTRNSTVPAIGKGFLSLKDFQSLIDQNAGIKKVELSNYGEIFLNPDLLEIMQYAFKRKVLLTAENGANLNLINTEVLDKAKKGTYKYRFNINYLDNFDKVIRENPYNYDEYREVPYSKYFKIDKNKDIIKVKDFLCNKPKYKKHDLVKNEQLFYTKYDIVFCRNVIIYFNYKLQNAVFDFFQKNLYKNGYLVLGMQEFIIGPMASYFERNGHAYIKKDKLVY